MRFFVSAIFILLISNTGFSQKVSWKSLEKEGDAFLETGRYAEAAEAFAKAVALKPEKEKLAAKAGAAFFNARDYKKALKMLRPIKKEAQDYPLAGFWYAKSLKAMGEFDKSISAFKNFRRNYPGDNSDMVIDMARTEIEGAELGIEKEGMPVIEQAVPVVINTDAQEFAPIAFSDDILYYSTNEFSTVKMMRSQFSGGEWSAPVVPDFPNTAGGHFGQGSFNDDQSAFYFTVCDNSVPWNSRDAQCDLYASKRENNSWTTPEKLRDYLKGDGSSATHPFVYQEDDMEVLIYSTDRSGGEGGMDLWKTSRPIDSDAFDFSFPQHLGRNINTKGDEITPFVNLSSGTLYFSSNGFANLGGFDIFTTPFNNLKDGYVENAGYPYNSNSDDYYYTMAQGGTVEFFTSNRATKDWETTTDDNIFQVGMASNPIAKISGAVKNRANEENIEHATVMLMEIQEDDKEVLLTTQVTKAGAFNLPVVSGKNYKLQAVADGYGASEVELNTSEMIEGMMEKTIYLSEFEMTEEVVDVPVVSKPLSTPTVSTSTVNTARETMANNVQETMENVVERSVENIPPRVVNTPVQTTEMPRRNSVSTTTPTYTSPTPVTTSTSRNTNSNTTYSNSSSFSSSSASVNTGEYTNGRFMGDGVRTSAPKLDGSYYKIQLSIVIDYNEYESSYQEVSHLGRLDTEFILARGWTRVLLSEFFSKEDALRVLNEARKRGFPEAFLVRYQDGYRKI